MTLVCRGPGSNPWLPVPRSGHSTNWAIGADWQCDSWKIYLAFSGKQTDPVVSPCLSHDPVHVLVISHWITIRASAWDYGTYHKGDQRSLRRACASAQSRQGLRCSYTWRMEVDERSNKKVKHLDPPPSPTGWLRMRVWRMSLRRTKSTIISWDGSLGL